MSSTTIKALRAVRREPQSETAQPALLLVLSLALLVSCDDGRMNTENLRRARPPGSPDPYSCDSDSDCVFAPLIMEGGVCCYGGANAQSRAYYEFMERARKQRCSEVCWEDHMHPASREVIVLDAKCEDHHCR